MEPAAVLGNEGTGGEQGDPDERPRASSLPEGLQLPHVAVCTDQKREGGQG